MASVEELRRQFPDLSQEALLWLSQQPEPERQALSLNRSQAEKFGLTDVDWKTLDILFSEFTRRTHDEFGQKLKFPEQIPSKRLIAEIDRMLSTGYINEYQARDIFKELTGRYEQGRLGVLYPIAEPEAKRRGIPWSETRRMPAKRQVTPQPRYDVGFEEERQKFFGEVPQTERVQQWFRGQFPRLLEQFEATQPRLGPLRFGATQVKEKREADWVKYIERADLRERYERLSPFEKGQRPQVQAPRIQTVTR